MHGDEIHSKRICPQYRSRHCYNECKWFGNCLDLEAGDALDPSETFCSSCGVVHHRIVMFGIGTGRNVKYLCPKCYLAAEARARCFVGERINVQAKAKKK